MIVSLQPSWKGGEIQAPASKSSMQRACAAALIAQGKTKIKNAGKSNDDLAALRMVEDLGAQVKRNEEKHWVELWSSGVRPGKEEVNCGESGLGIRMFAPIIALSQKAVQINGKGSLLTRPMHFFDQVFPQLVVNVHSKAGYLPIRLQGPLVPKDIQIDGSLSSQFLTGLLFAYSASCSKPTTIEVSNLTSRPYIDLTLSVLKDFGLPVPRVVGYETFHFEQVPYLPDPGIERTYEVEGDWSGGAFLVVAGAITDEITVLGLDSRSTQADKAILKALESCGAMVQVDSRKIRVAGPVSGTLRGFDFDATQCPDLFPPLVALAAYCDGNTTILGANRLTHKESNRAMSLQQEFSKMSVDIKLEGDRMVVCGKGAVKGATVHSHHDHRIAMACAVAGLRSEGPTQIEDAEAINKSYPDFFNDLKALGVNCQVRDAMHHS